MFYRQKIRCYEALVREREHCLWNRTEAVVNGED